MPIAGVVTYKPLKGGYISVELEVEDTLENRLALAPMHKLKAVLLSQEEWQDWPMDRKSMLLEILQLSAKVHDMVTKEMAAWPVPPIATLDISGLADLGIADGAEPLQAADEIPTMEDPPANDFYGDKKE